MDKISEIKESFEFIKRKGQKTKIIRILEYFGLNGKLLRTKKTSAGYGDTEPQKKFEMSKLKASE